LFRARQHRSAIMADDGRFDDLLLAMARKHDSVEDLSYSVLSFFERRTDLFHIMETREDRMGFLPGNAENMFFKHFHFFQHKYLGRVQPHVLKEAYGTTEPPASESSNPALQDAAAAEASSSKAPPATLDVASDSAPAGASAASSNDASRPAMETPSRPSQPASDASGALPEQTRKMMRHISTWNGAITDKYYWTQSLHEVTLEVQVEEGCTAKDVNVDVKSTRISVACKGKTVLEGKLHDKVCTDGSIWHLDDNRQVVITMEKQRETWWKCVLEGDQEIDTTKVESTRAIEEYDGETQGAIRKILFDQNQKMQGKPSSDQIRTASVMRDAWNAPNSPFRGTEFDPTMLNLSGPVSEDFFQDVDQRRIEEARKNLEQPQVSPDV